MPKLKLVANGVARASSQSPSPKGVPIRLPTTPDILRQIHQLWFPARSNTDTMILWATCTTAFFSFFRLGEITVPSQSSLDPKNHMCLADMAIDSRESPSLIRLQLKVSIYLVLALTSYLAIRGETPGPLFRFSDSSPLTKDRFIKQVRLAPSTLGFDPTSYAGHRLRIGAATTAAERGVEDSIIKTLGRWTSDAFQAYVKSPETGWLC